MCDIIDNIDCVTMVTLCMCVGAGRLKVHSMSANNVGNLKS